MIALRAGVPLIPVSIKMKKMRWCLFRRIDIIIGAPIAVPAQESDTETPSQTAARATKLVMEAIYTQGGWQKKEEESK